jgi:hypothetical protein
MAAREAIIREPPPAAAPNLYRFAYPAGKCSFAPSFKLSGAMKNIFPWVVCALLIAILAGMAYSISDFPSPD